MWDGNDSAYAGHVAADSPTATDGGATRGAMSQVVPERPAAATNASPDELTPAQRLAVGALVSGTTFTAAAEQAGVCRKTLQRWRQDPAFARAVNDLSREALEATAMRARALMLSATHALAEAMRGRDRTAWSMRVLNSGRVWKLASQLPDPPPVSA